MFGSSKKPVVFSPSGYRQRRRGLPGWFISLLIGMILGSTSLWFLLSNYGPPRISLAEAQQLQRHIDALTQDKQQLQHRILELEQHLSQTQQLVKQLQPVQTTSPALQLNDILAKLPPTQSEADVQLRQAKFYGRSGELGYELVFTRHPKHSQAIPIRIEIHTSGQYQNGKQGYAQLAPVQLQATPYIRLDESQLLNKTTLMPQNVEVKVLHEDGRVISKQWFKVTHKP